MELDLVLSIAHTLLEDTRFATIGELRTTMLEKCDWQEMALNWQGLALNQTNLANAPNYTEAFQQNLITDTPGNKGRV